MPTEAAILVALIPTLAAIGFSRIRAKLFAQLGGAAAQSDLVETLQGLNSAKDDEITRLRADLAGCESENRRYRRGFDAG